MTETKHVSREPAAPPDAQPRVGQRWLSETEPDLGLGLVVGVSARTLTVEFRACEERRVYALGNAPLRRAALHPGDRAIARDGRAIEVADVRSRDGLLLYVGPHGEQVAEADLADATSLGSPVERLSAGLVDSERLFEVRRATLDLEHRRRGSRARGFVGSRIELIPHQLSIAAEVTSRWAPRVLLADEVGLGKGIEAGLIVHRLLQTERVRRVLFLVPEALVLQWLVELLRRFDLHPAIATPEWWAHERAPHGSPEAANPFADEPLVLCPLGLLVRRGRVRLALEAGWDLLIVDEAHRLRWAPEDPSPEYRVVEALGQRTRGVLLLTATPEQLGLAGHFARLRLLDPARYSDPGELERAVEWCAPTAALVRALDGTRAIEDAPMQSLRGLLANEPSSSRQRLLDQARGDAAAREEVIAALIDRHGTGRAVFRNTRAAIGGFPERRLRLVPLAATIQRDEQRAQLSRELEDDVRGTERTARDDLRHDVRVAWLAGLLRELGDDKVLLICRTAARVRAIDASLERHLRVATAHFHEELELLQRDRQAAWFAEENGARIMIASELGSEGRNFQFAHHLVLFDLPLDPELLEQRIGRLDRIGQRETIEIHVPFVRDSPQEALAVWYHEGLDAFRQPVRTGRAMAERFGGRLVDVARAFAAGTPGHQGALAALVDETRQARVQREAELSRSRDLLLERSSFRPALARELDQDIRAADADPALERLMLALWDHFVVSVEDLAPRTYRVGAEGSPVEGFPGLRARGLTVTFDRARALAREDVAFLTWDHPMVTGAVDLFLGRPDGNAAVTVVADTSERGVWLETVHVLECLAPPALHVDRFLAPTPLRRVVAADGADVTDRATELLAGRRASGSSPTPRALPRIERARLRALVESAARAAEDERVRRIAEAGVRMRALLDHEIERLRSLAALNPAVRPDEVAVLEREREALALALANARLRLDALRLVVLDPTPVA